MLRVLFCTFPVHRLLFSTRLSGVQQECAWRKFPIDVLKYVFRDHHDQRYLLPLRTTLRLLLLIICCRAP